MYTDLFVSPSFLQMCLFDLIVRCLLQAGVGCVTFVAVLQYFPWELILYSHFLGGSPIFQLPAFDASASNSVLMDMRHGRKI